MGHGASSAFPNALSNACLHHICGRRQVQREHAAWRQSQGDQQAEGHAATEIVAGGRAWLEANRTNETAWESMIELLPVGTHVVIRHPGWWNDGVEGVVKRVYPDDNFHYLISGTQRGDDGFPKNYVARANEVVPFDGTLSP